MDISNQESGIVYRNPVPHVFSRHAYFPSVIEMDNGELLASFATGESFEAANLNTYVCRSADRGITWSEPTALMEINPDALLSNCARITSLRNGEVIAVVVQHHRKDHYGEGLANPENLGFVPTDMLLVRSGDYGRSWDKPELIRPPLTGPSFELCSRIVELKDGRWIWPTSTWRGWDGDCPNGMKMVAWVSADKGRTWPSYMDVMNNSEDRLIYWESKITELQNDNLLAVAWAYDEKHDTDLPNHYSLSSDGGKTWQDPRSTQIQGQTMAVSELPDGRILSVYRRKDKPGLWANVCRIESNRWVNEKELPLWGVSNRELLDKSDNMVHDFNELKFGAPDITLLSDSSIFITFWCYEKLVSNIRWIRLSL